VVAYDRDRSRRRHGNVRRQYLTKLQLVRSNDSLKSGVIASLIYSQAAKLAYLEARHQGMGITVVAAIVTWLAARMRA